MESMFDFISVLFIVFGVLQIILFFKIWGMTNDVSKITKVQSINDNLIKAKVHYLKGEKGKAEELLMDSFLHDISVLNSCSNSSEWIGRYRVVYEKYAEMFKKVGVPVPDFNKYMNPDTHL